MRAWLRQLPNLISAFRILLVLPIGFALMRENWSAAIGLIVIATLSDGADGFLAKRFAWQTPLGAVLDPAADKLLVATLFITLALRAGVPVWLMAAAVGRDLLIVVGALAYRLRYGALRIRPSVVSKINTLCQLTFVLCVVSRREVDWPGGAIELALGALTFVTIAVSAIDYLRRYALEARRFSGRGVVA